MKTYLFQLSSFYLFLIGLWRLDNSIQKDLEFEPASRRYNPLRDLFSLKKVFLWVGQSIKDFPKDDYPQEASITRSQFLWGFVWIVLAVILQIIPVKINGLNPF